jgi:hypothetical protein
MYVDESPKPIEEQYTEIWINAIKVSFRSVVQKIAEI